MTPKEGRRAPDSAPRRDPFGMINGEGIITGTVVSAAASPGRRGGLGLGGSLMSASIGAALGVLIILMKAGRH